MKFKLINQRDGMLYARVIESPKTSHQIVAMIEDEYTRKLAAAIIEVAEKKKRKTDGVIYAEAWDALRSMREQRKKARAFEKAHLTSRKIVAQIRDLATKLEEKHKMRIRIPEISVDGTRFLDGFVSGTYYGG